MKSSAGSFWFLFIFTSGPSRFHPALPSSSSKQTQDAETHVLGKSSIFEPTSLKIIPGSSGGVSRPPAELASSCAALKPALGPSCPLSQTAHLHARLCRTMHQPGNGPCCVCSCKPQSSAAATSLDQRTDNALIFGEHSDNMLACDSELRF